MTETAKDPFSYLYLLYKIHKPGLTTHPICSDCASTPHALGQYVDETLQPMVKTQQTYFKDSFALKNILDTLHIPPNVSLFTYDAISMYTNIDMEDCINRLSDYLHSPETWFSFKHYTPEALIEAIKLVMHNNRMQFGDVFVCQVSGIAMGMSPAPTIANLYIAIYEQCHLLKHLEISLFFLKPFIDDGIGIWLHNADPDTDKQNWQEFKAMVNGSGIPWPLLPTDHLHGHNNFN